VSVIIFQDNRENRFILKTYRYIDNILNSRPQDVSMKKGVNGLKNNMFISIDGSVTEEGLKLHKFMKEKMPFVDKERLYDIKSG